MCAVWVFSVSLQNTGVKQCVCEILDETEVYFGVYVKKRDIWGRLCEMTASWASLAIDL